MTLWIRIPDPDQSKKIVRKKSIQKLFLKLNVNVKHTLHYAMHAVMEGGRASNLL
jgi:hypothetical protein